jgi:thiamine biosynthesis lipoprotein
VSAKASFRALGTTAELVVSAPSSLPAARTILEQELDRIDRACSRFRGDSELSRLNAAGGRPIGVSELFATAVDTAIRAARLTDGAVDPTVGAALRAIGYDRDFEALRAKIRRPASGALVPGWQVVELDVRARTARVPQGVVLDLGATAKALAADRAASQIHEALGCGTLVSLGGDISTAGVAPEGGWSIGVCDDGATPAAFGAQTVSVASGAVATSSTRTRRWTMADGEERHHIIDPRLGRSARAGWRTVSVAAACCVDANTASTAAIVRPQAAPSWLGAQRLPARLVATSGEVRLVGGWPAGTAVRVPP